MRANAASANARRVSAPTVPSFACSSVSSGPYWSGLVTIVTHAWFFAAARVIAGPPMSIVSMSGRCSNGIEVRHDELERPDAVEVEVVAVALVAEIGEQPAVDLRVQRLHAAVEHLG